MPPRDFCTARRTPTNTPLQALVTLNDVVYQEAARAIAERVQKEIAGDDEVAAVVEKRIARAFDLVISREPTASERQRLLKLYDLSLAESDGSTAPANQRLRALGDVAAAILNLDAAFVR
jgi:hypothetical protein